jgi:hypothetical protein
MKEYRVHFSDPRAVNIEAESEEAAKEIVRNREWEYGMDFEDGAIEITDVSEL